MSLQDTVHICSDALYRGHLIPASIPETLFLECMCLATEVVELCFDKNMYTQKDEVSMGSPLGPILANIFIRFYEGLWFKKFCQPYVCLYASC